MAIAIEHSYHERRGGERRRIAYSRLLRGADGKRVSWGGIWGGVLVAVGLLLLLAVLGVAIGVSATGAGIWAGVSLLLALFVGGLVATRIGAIFDGTTGFFEGVLVWVVSALLMALLASSGVSSIAGGAFGMIGGASDAVGAVMQGADQAQAATAAWITFGGLVLSLLAAVLGAMAGSRLAYPTSTGT
jgi:hypothetical protein